MDGGGYIAPSHRGFFRDTRGINPLPCRREVPSAWIRVAYDNPDTRLWRLDHGLRDQWQNQPFDDIESRVSLDLP